jgi:hypothetical protein
LQCTAHPDLEGIPQEDFYCLVGFQRVSSNDMILSSLFTNPYLCQSIVSNVSRLAQ